MVIRKAQPQDATVLYQIGITEEGFALSAETRFYSLRFLQKWIKAPDNDLLLVAEVDGEIAGFLFCRVVRGDWAMLENIAVVPQRQGQGIGTRLIEECFARLHAKGIGYVAGLVKENNDKALEFFRDRGFSPGTKFMWIETQVRGRHDCEENR